MDAFYDLGIDANLSEGAGLAAILSYFGGHTLAEVNAAARELRPLLAILDAGEEAAERGSALLSALFVGRALSLDGARTDIGEILRDDYGVYVFHDDPLAANVNRFLEERTSKDYFEPFLLDDGDGLPADSDAASKTALSLSAFDFFAHFFLGEFNRNAYKKETQLFHYTDKNGNVSSVPYGYDGGTGKIYDGEGFTACDSSLGATFVKPDSGKTPWDIIGAVADGACLNGGKDYEITSKITYFIANTSFDLPCLGTYGDGVFSAFVEGMQAEDYFVTSQKSKVTLSPEGLTRQSVTVTINATSALEEYELDFDSPFAFRQDLTLKVSESGKTTRLPLFLGVVETPNYSE